MNRKRILVMVLAMILIVATVVAATSADDPGSAGDPVVTKSYVDSQIEALKTSGGSAGVFEAVSVKAGQKVIGGAGTEMILRSGEAFAIDNGVDGLSDLTAAKDILGDTKILANHLLLVPRDDGRGIGANTDIWVMIKGSYTLK